MGDNIFPEDQQIPVFPVPPGQEIGLLHTHKHQHIHTVSHPRDSRVVEVRPHIYHFNSSFSQGRLYKKQCCLARLTDIKHWRTVVQVASVPRWHCCKTGIKSLQLAASINMALVCTSATCLSLS